MIFRKINRYINTHYPQVFEYFFDRFLARLIKESFVPDYYTFYTSAQEINGWGEHYFEYFKIKKEESILKNQDTLHVFDVFNWYAGYYYDSINPFLRYNVYKLSETPIVKRIQIIDREMKRFHLKENTVVLRRISKNALYRMAADNKIGKGSVLTENGYMSTSLNMHYRMNNESQYKPIDSEVLILIKVPRGTNAMYLEALSPREEYELLLPRGLKLIVEERKSVLGNIILLARVDQSMGISVLMPDDHLFNKATPSQ